MARCNEIMFRKHHAFICDRIDNLPNPDDLPKGGKYVYGIRHGDDSVVPKTVEDAAVVDNFWGDLVTKEKLQMGEKKYLRLTAKEQGKFLDTRIGINAIGEEGGLSK